MNISLLADQISLPLPEAAGQGLQLAAPVMSWR